MSSPRGFLVGGMEARRVNGLEEEVEEVVDLVGFEVVVGVEREEEEGGVAEDRVEEEEGGPWIPEGGVGAEGRRREKGKGTKGIRGVGWTRMLRCMLSDRRARLA